MSGPSRTPLKAAPDASRSKERAAGRPPAPYEPTPLDLFQESIGNQALVRRLTPEADPRDDADAALAELGPGRPFEGAERSGMESAFQQDFSRVRIHDDATAAKMSGRMNAHALTVGDHIAFARDRHRPGTLLGDALLAHELAHTLQQRQPAGGGIRSFGVRDQEYDALENDADLSAMRAMHRLWGASAAAGADLPASAMPRLRSGLRVSLNSCFGSTPTNCAPLSMTKVTSGPFQGGKKMDDYFPDLVGQGLWQHGDTAGPWDTGTWAGSNVQLIGTHPSGCDSSKYTLGQTVKYDKAIFNGTHHADEGKTMDDVKASGRDQSQAPFRHVWDDKISMADPPSFKYSAVQDVEFDRTFVTSLSGPGGTVSVTWQTSIAASGGKLTKNTVS